MNCADIMSTDVEWLTEQDSVQKAASVMAEAGIGFLPICDAHQVIGVVTDRDLTIRVLAKTVEPGTTSVGLVMTAPPITCLETADVREAEELMCQRAEGPPRDHRRRRGSWRACSAWPIWSSTRPAERASQIVRAVLWCDVLGLRAGATGL